MWFSLALVLLLLAITYFQTIQGLFSALLSAVLTILCAALAFATFEYMAVQVLAPLQADYALGLSLMGMFVIPLLILRLVLDQYVHRACLLPMIVDKAGGLVFGLLAAYVMVGMLAVGVQLMPFGSGFLSFTRLDAQDPAKEQNELWLSPDRFAVRVVSMLSGGVFSGQQAFTAVHPDFITEIGWIDGVIPEKGADRRAVRRFAPPGSMKLRATWEDSDLHRRTDGGKNKPTQYEPKKAESGHKLLRVLMDVDRNAQDPDHQHRFSLFQVRMVGQRGDRAVQYHAVGVADAEDPTKAIYELKGQGDAPFLTRLFKPNAQGQIDVAFEVPKDFEPHFVEYKSGAREIVKLGQAAPAGPTAVAGATPAAPPPPGGGPPPAPTPRGRTGGLAVKASFFGEEFPGGLVMTAYEGRDSEVDDTRQALKGGHIYGWLENQGQPRGKPPAARFEVPPDKRLLHLSVESLRAGSTLGKALSLSVTTMKNYVLSDDSGRQYLPVGAYVIGNLGVKPYVEIQYNPEYAELTGRAVRPWERLTEARLKGDYTLVFLYLVEPGAKLVRFSTGGGGVAPIDLQTANLTAPGEAASGGTAPQKKEVPVKPEILRKYVGKYEVEPGKVFEVTLDDGKLMVKFGDQPKVQVFPESETKLFYKVIDAEITFVKDPSGKVTGLVFVQRGPAGKVEWKAKKVS